MITIKVKDNIDRFITKCINNNINLENIIKNNNELYVDINSKDYKLVKRINYYSEIKIIKKDKKHLLKSHLLKYILDYINLVIFLVIIFINSNIIIKIEIKHENKNIKQEIKRIVNEYGINIFTIKKDLEELNKISEEILYKNRDILKWISINNEGMKYIISLEERIETKKTKEEKHCNIISTKDAIITKIINNKGITVAEKNKHVTPEEILITGQITLNDAVKDNICADGRVFGETWYKIHISKPLKYISKKYTNNSVYNIKINNKYLKKIKYKHYDEKIIYNFKNIQIAKLQEYTVKELKYSPTEAKKIAITESIEKLKKEIPENSIILEKKVLKETQNNSKIDIDIFVSVEQIISKRITYEVGEINGDDTR